MKDSTRRSVAAGAALALAITAAALAAGAAEPRFVDQVAPSSVPLPERSVSAEELVREHLEDLERGVDSWVTLDP